MIYEMDRIVVIDNYDSFTYNLVHALNHLSGSAVTVFRNDRVSMEALEEFGMMVLSPGPGIPCEAGSLKQIISRFAPSRRMLGVCLGHQAIAEVFGAKLVNIDRVYHGVATKIKVVDENDYLYTGIDNTFNGGRYHSWMVSRDELPDCFTVTAVAENGDIMGISHKRYDIRGVQYHPESVLTEAGEAIIMNWLRAG
jgi:anthranilate synthase component 2